MKKSLLVLVALFLASTVLKAQSGMTDDERKFAVKYLTDTKSEVVKLVKKLSDEQLNYKPDADSWSVAECLKHIAISEQNIWAGFVDASLAQDPDPSKRSGVSMSDEQLIGIIESREQKVKTAPPFEPQNKPEAADVVLKEFQKLRDEHIKFAKKSDEDLRNRYGQLPFGTIDAYQAIIFMAGHTRRHYEQMKEVMASDGFPD